MKAPRIEIVDKRGDEWRIQFTVYLRPLGVYTFGRWIIGGPR